MSVNLQKGQRINLEKDGGGDLKKVIVGLGWDVADGGPNIDCDAVAIVCGPDGKVIGNDLKNVVYFGNLKHSSGAVMHTGDNLTGAGEGDDEQIIVDVPKVPSPCGKIVFAVSLYEGRKRRQHFGMINNAFIRAVDVDTGKELFKYDLSENYNGKTGMIFGEMYRKDGKWKFNAIGQPLDEGSYVQDLVNQYV